MATRSERDKSKVLQEKHQAILSQLLKEEDNKYCVDCDAKGPRWASWNLGVFLCIRCAGIHRNLGVHISKVKSVNLDSWTSEQLGMVQEMGNSRARALYEAYLPDHFRRPQTDSTLEAFIRAKYEQKKYAEKGFVPPQPKVQLEDTVIVERTVVEEKKEKKKARPRPSANPNIQLSGPNKASPASSHKPTATSTASASAVTTTPKAAPPKKESNIDDLIGLDSSVAAPVSGSQDLFSDFMGAPVTSSTAGVPASTVSDGLDQALFAGSTAEIGSTEPTKSTKDSIMALYGSASQQQQQQQQQQNFGVPGGMYINQPGGQQQMNIMAPNPMQNGLQNGMMPGTNMMSGTGVMPGANVGMMGMTPNPAMMGQGMQMAGHPNLMVVDPMAQLRTNLIQSMVNQGSAYMQSASSGKHAQPPTDSGDNKLVPSAQTLFTPAASQSDSQKSPQTQYNAPLSGKPVVSSTPVMAQGDNRGALPIDRPTSGFASLSTSTVLTSTPYAVQPVWMTARQPSMDTKPNTLSTGFSYMEGGQTSFVHQNTTDAKPSAMGVYPVGSSQQMGMGFPMQIYNTPVPFGPGQIQHSSASAGPVPPTLNRQVHEAGTPAVPAGLVSQAIHPFGGLFTGGIGSGGSQYTGLVNNASDALGPNCTSRTSGTGSDPLSRSSMPEQQPPLRAHSPMLSNMSSLKTEGTLTAAAANDMLVSTELADSGTLVWAPALTDPSVGSSHMGQMMMGQVGGMPAMQTGQMMGSQAGMSQIGQPVYGMAAPGMYNMPQQQVGNNRQFQHLANQMAGMSIGAQSIGGYQPQGGIVAGGAGGAGTGGGGGMWAGNPQPGQTLSTNLWQ